MDRPNVEEISKGAYDGMPTNVEAVDVQNLCQYILYMERQNGDWTHKGANEWFKETCELILWEGKVPYSWFTRVCREYGYGIPISVFRRFANSGKTVFDLDSNKGRPLAYFAAVCENIYQEQKQAKESGEAPPPYYKEYEAHG